MKKMTKKLVMSFLSLGFAIVALGTTTFAWFTATASATASNIKVSVDAADSGVLVSKDTINFTSKLVFDDADFDGTTLAPVTRTGVSTFESKDGGAINIATDTAILKVTLYFTAQGNEVKTLYIPTLDVKTQAAPEAYTILKTFEYGATTTELTAGAKVKVSAVNALRLETGVYPTAVDHDGTDKSSAEFGIKADHKLYKFNDTVNTVTNFGDDMTATAAANAYYAAITGENAPATTADGAVAAIAKETLSGIAEGSTTIVAARMIKVDFFFYLEGFDADCFDAIGEQGLTINLGFSTAEPK